MTLFFNGLYQRRSDYNQGLSVVTQLLKQFNKSITGFNVENNDN